MKGFFKSLCVNLALSFGALIVSLLIAEIVIRIAVPLPESLRRRLEYSVLETSDNMALRYALKPNASNFAHGAHNRINSAGFRDREYPVEKMPGVTRIAFLGDSVTYGDGIEAEETVPDQLEKILSDHGHSAEIINMAVYGYETVQQVELFKERGLKFKPDWVFLGYCLNDTQQASGEIEWFHTLTDRKVKRYRPSPYRAFLEFLYEHSKLLMFLDLKFEVQKRFKFLRAHQSIFKWLYERNQSVQDSESSEFYGLRKKIEEEAQRTGMSADSLNYALSNIGLKNIPMNSSHWHKVTKPALQELKALADKHQFKVAAVVYPFIMETQRYGLKPLHDFLNKEFEALGFEVIDLLPWANEASLKYSDLELARDGLHWTPIGARMAAEYLYREIERRKIAVSS